MDGDLTINVGVDCDSRWLLRWSKLSGLNVPRLKECPFCKGNRLSLRASDDEGVPINDGTFLDIWERGMEYDGKSTDPYKTDYENDPSQEYLYDLDRVLADVTAETMDTIARQYVSYVCLDCDCGCTLYQSADTEGLTAIPKLFARWQKGVNRSENNGGC